VQPPLQVKQAALLQVAAGELGQLAPGAQGVELGLLGFVGGEAELGDCAAARRVVELGIAGEPADQDHPVDGGAAELATALLVVAVDDLESVSRPIRPMAGTTQFLDLLMKREPRSLPDALIRTTIGTTTRRQSQTTYAARAGPRTPPRVRHQLNLEGVGEEGPGALQCPRTPASTQRPDARDFRRRRSKAEAP